MISYIKGELVEMFEDSIVVENNGIGFNIKVPESVLAAMPATGHKVKIYTYLAIKEDSHTLFGFMSRDDLKVFRLLLNVNGIGPKGALAILSTITPDDLRFAVVSEDVKLISSAPGIGKKTAQKLIIELKDKLKPEEAFEIAFNKNSEITDSFTIVRNETIEALVSLGYSASEAMKAVNGIEQAESMGTEELLKAALKKMSFM